MSFVVGSSGGPTSGVVTEMLRQMILSHRRQIADAFDDAVGTGLPSDLATTHAAVIVDGRTPPGREFLCQAGFHGRWTETDFPVLMLPRLDLSLLMNGVLDNVLRVPPTPGTLVVIAIGAGSEADSAGIALMELRYRQRLWMPHS